MPKCINLYEKAHLLYGENICSSIVQDKQCKINGFKYCKWFTCAMGNFYTKNALFDHKRWKIGQIVLGGPCKGSRGPLDYHRHDLERVFKTIKSMAQCVFKPVFARSRKSSR
jgi:hypothetical protein